MDSRIIIEQAKGKLAERLSCAPNAAFTALRGYARSNRLKLRDLAARVVNNDPEVTAAFRSSAVITEQPTPTAAGSRGPS